MYTQQNAKCARLCNRAGPHTVFNAKCARVCGQPHTRPALLAKLGLWALFGAAAGLYGAALLTPLVALLVWGA